MKVLLKQPALLAAVLSAIAYSLTIAPTISHTDSGELAAVCYTWGVAHPTGYPLFTMLGGLFARLPLGSVAFSLNVMCLLFTAGAVFVWGKVLERFLAGWLVKVDEKDVVLGQRVAWANFTAVLGGALLLGLGVTWWTQSTSAEVYSLHGLLLATNLFFLLKAFQSNTNGLKPWLWVAVSLALLFSNHLTAIVLIPGIAWLFFRKMGFKKQAWVTIGAMLGLFLVVLTLIYSWLPLRAGSDATLVWGDTRSWETIWHHISGRQFSVWMFTGAKAFNINLSEFFGRLPFEVGVGLLLAIPGIGYAWKFKRDWAVFFLISIAANVLWACNYAIKDLEPYFLLALLGLTFFSAIGFRWIWLRMKGSMGMRTGLSAGAAAAILGVAAFNYTKVDQRGAWQYEDYARAAMTSVPSNAIILSQAWDVLVSPSYYLQKVESFRPDITILDYPMLQNRHWYPDFIQRNAPELAATLGKDLELWNEAVDGFDLNQKPDMQILPVRFRTIVQKILAQYKSRPVYVSPELIGEFGVGTPNSMLPAGTTAIPEQYLYRIVPMEDLMKGENSPVELYPLRHHRNFGDSEDVMIVNFLRSIIEARIRYAQGIQQMDKAQKLQTLLAGLPVLAPVPPKFR